MAVTTREPVAEDRGELLLILWRAVGVVAQAIADLEQAVVCGGVAPAVVCGVSDGAAQQLDRVLVAWDRRGPAGVEAVRCCLGNRHVLIRGAWRLAIELV